jgi:plastocyanin
MSGRSDAEMARQVANWYAAHPAHGEQSTAAPIDSFSVANDFFDENHDGAATQVDTAVIFQGETVLWKWVVGIHTVTSGTGASDPNAGHLFDVPSTTSARTFSFQFDSAGVVPFFCRNHELQNMRGFVRVQSTASVEPLGGAPRGAGFVAPPWPNPSHGTTAFRLSLPVAGHARATIFDVSGRRVATPLDRDLAAGVYAAAWDGRRGDGSPAPAGVYLVALEVPGASQSRRIALER